MNARQLVFVSGLAPVISTGTAFAQTRTDNDHDRSEQT
jgi:hypothetical protein